MTTVIKQPTHADLAPKTTEQEARDVAEAAREKEWESPSFVRELFEGDFDLDLIHPFPEPDPADVAQGQPFMERLEKFLREQVDSDKIDREGKIPPEVIAGAPASWAPSASRSPTGVRRPGPLPVQLHPGDRPGDAATTAA